MCSDVLEAKNRMNVCRKDEFQAQSKVLYSIRLWNKSLDTFNKVNPRHSQYDRITTRLCGVEYAARYSKLKPRGRHQVDDIIFDEIDGTQTKEMSAYVAENREMW